ncbi:MAG: hypothetical protein M3T56_15505 [Chloroflexota bacterium]|nr:hypothetical protein [Chloroflexota bacterium]
MNVRHLVSFLVIAIASSCAGGAPASSPTTTASALSSLATADDVKFSGVRAVAVEATGNVYVVDTGNDRVVKLGPTGQVLLKWGSTGRGDGQFSQPSGITLDGVGNLYVADTGNHRIQKFTITAIRQSFRKHGIRER